MRNTFSIIILLSLFNNLFAQDKRTFRGSIRFSCTIPNPTSNLAFKKSFVGIYEVNVSFNYNFFKGIGIGATYKNGLFSLPISKGNLSGPDTKAEVNYVGGKLNYDIFLSDITMFSASINVGKNFTKYTSVVCLNPMEGQHKFSSTYIEPELNMYFFIQENLAIGVNVSEVIVAKSFDPYSICLNETLNLPYISNEISGLTSYLNFGFSVYVGLFRKKEE